MRDDAFPAGPAAVRVAGREVEADCSRDPNTISAAFLLLKEVADDLFRVASRVTVGCVDEVAALVQIARQNGLGVGNAGTPAQILAEAHGAKAKRADAQAGAAEGNERIERHFLSWMVIAMSEGGPPSITPLLRVVCGSSGSCILRMRCMRGVHGRSHQIY